MGAEAQSRAESSLDLDELLDLYLDEERKRLDREDVERARLRAAFEAGTPLTALAPVELYDPVEGGVERAPAGAVFHVAEHQGDVVIGRLSDNSHSLAIIYEPPDHWVPRKHFLPLATLVDRTLIEQGASPAAQTREGRVKGAHHTGQDLHAARVVQDIEALADRDAFALLARGTHLMIDGSMLPEARISGTVIVEVTSAVGDVRKAELAERQPPISVRLPDGRHATLPFEALQHLDFRTQVFSPAAWAREVASTRARRGFLRKVFGGGLALAWLGLDATLWVSQEAEWPPEAPPADRVLSALIPQLASVVGYLQAGGKYWYELDGPIFSLKQAGAYEAAHVLSDALTLLGVASDQAIEAWRAAFYKRVHVGWRETRHYKRDKDGNRRYSHSTWSKQHRHMWLEPRGLEGSWRVIEGWDQADDHRRRRGDRLMDEPILQLLECSPEEAESQFQMLRQEVSFARDATLSAISAAAITAPAAFFSDILSLAGGRMAWTMHPGRGVVPAQKPALLAMGAVAGVFAARRADARVNAELGQNKKALGALLEAQLAEVPALSFEGAWVRFLGNPSPERLIAEVSARAQETISLCDQAHGFTYVHGTGRDHGRRLDPVTVDASPVHHVFPGLVDRWQEGAQRLQQALARQVALLPALKCAVGTDVLNARMEEDADEAKSGPWKRALWIGGPVWGAALLDAVLKAMIGRR